jgi:hypothetical protein
LNPCQDYFVIAIYHGLEDEFKAHIVCRVFAYNIKDSFDFFTEILRCDNQYVLYDLLVLSGRQELAEEGAHREAALQKCPRKGIAKEILADLLQS